jgi:FkbM family methyltransferase
MQSTVKYDDFSIDYYSLDSHAHHAPTKITRNGKIWEKKLYNFYKDFLKPHHTVYDIGTYIGTHAIPMSKYCKFVMAFEPSLELYDVLQKNIALNNIKNILAVNRAVGRGETKDFYERNDGTSRIADKEIKGEKKSVSTVCLDHLKGLCITATDRVDLMKIDVEGHEFEVLEGAKIMINKYRPTILIEVFKKNKKKLNEWCFENNYMIEKLGGGDDYILKPYCV